MTRALRLWLKGRSVRERRMLAVMAAALAAVAVWYGLVAPLRAWRVAAADRLADAVAERATVQKLASRLSSDTPKPQALAQIEVAARAAADKAGLNAEIAVADGALRVVADGATTPAAFGWLAAMQADYGASPSLLEATDAGGGLIDLTAQFGR